jgi:hypothetical protein
MKKVNILLGVFALFIYQRGYGQSTNLHNNLRSSAFKSL